MMRSKLPLYPQESEFSFAYKRHLHTDYESPGHFLQSHYRYKMGSERIASPTEDGVQE